ncbi:hypothetical protein ACAH01_01030 [Halomicrobium sp. HM KBTZ05]|uniref:DUF8130 domain-containing protein n=1 Tax=Halomicrobium mukohataei TaxID=57705 RepID=A0A847U0I2_9EURY|nr:hypothetical protein [Halomicrobium mukohataei]NLV09103.1 hypothetical protein [Halomicrobium mukohataei]
MNVERRRLLHSLAGSALIGVSGCLGRPDASNTSESPTTTAAETPSLSSLSLTGAVETQSTTDHPARISLSLANRGDSAVTVHMGPTLLFTDNSSAQLEWADAIAIEPAGRGAELSADPVREGECWRVPDTAVPVVQSSLDAVPLGSDEPVTETYEVYTRGVSGTCLPSGQYRFEDQIYLETEDRPIVLSVVLSVTDDQQIRFRSGGVSPP